MPPIYHKNSPDSIKKMFSSIAPKYDIANALISFGLHKVWNEKLVNLLSGHHHLLDLCSGTGEIAFSFLQKESSRKAILLDFCSSMLDVATKKGARFETRFQTIVADAQHIPLLDQSVDAITIAYGIRNVKDPTQCFLEAFRLLEKGGTFAILELTRPTSLTLQKCHSFYLKLFLPLFALCISKNKSAYDYLAQSITTFSSPLILKNNLLEIGFHSVEIKSLMGGIATIISCKK